MSWAISNDVSPSVVRHGREKTGWAGRGKARIGAEGRGEARRGTARADDLSTEGYGSPCWVLWNPVLVRQGRAWPGEAWHGEARSGQARHGVATATDGGTEPLRRFPAILTDGFGTPGRGGARLGAAWRGEARRGEAWQGLQTAARRVMPSLLLSQWEQLW